jgi:hypothetical protein
MKHALARMSVALAIGGFAVAAPAQQAAAPASPAPVPKHNCAKPDEYPGNLASNEKKNAWQKTYVAYVDCLKKFITEEQALAEPHVKASNDAINEYNAGVKAYNAEIEKAKGGS